MKNGTSSTCNTTSALIFFSWDNFVVFKVKTCAFHAKKPHMLQNLFLRSWKQKQFFNLLNSTRRPKLNMNKLNQQF